MAVLVLSGTAAQAQESNTIGPPVLSDFELRPGNQAAPQEPAPMVAPLPAPTPPASQPNAGQQSPAPVVAIPAPSAPVTRQPAPAPRNSGAPVRQTPVSPAPAAGNALPPAAVAIPGETVSAPPLELSPADTPAVQAPLPTPSVFPDAAPATPQPGTGTDWWLYLLFFGLAGGLGYVVLRRRGTPEPAFAAPAAPRARPVAVPEAPETTLRPWLELDFRPNQAGTNDTHASVQFELTVRNVGESPAQDIRVEGRMFNAGADQDREISAFFTQPEPARAAQAPQGLVPLGEANFRSVVSMPREMVKEVRVNGRRLFIPMVAFNVLYSWEEGSGQTSASYLLGIEGKEPSERMGAFRLDLGPRIYRALGRREHRLSRRI